MRLARVRNGRGLKARFLLVFLTLAKRVRVPDILRVLLYRPEYFGRPYNEWIHAILRGPSKWSVGERELFASFTSRSNQCHF